jgi:hypothetical protein
MPFNAGVLAGWGESVHEQTLMDIKMRLQQKEAAMEALKMAMQSPHIHPDALPQLAQRHYEIAQIDPGKPLKKGALDLDMTMLTPGSVQQGQVSQKGTQIPTRTQSSLPQGNIADNFRNFQTIQPPPSDNPPGAYQDIPMDKRTQFREWEAQNGPQARRERVPMAAQAAQPQEMPDFGGTLKPIPSPPTMQTQSGQKRSMYMDAQESTEMAAQAKKKERELLAPGEIDEAIKKAVGIAKGTEQSKIDVALATAVPVSVPGLVPGAAIKEDLQTDSSGEPIDESSSYHVIRNKHTGELISATRAAEGVSWRTDWMRDAESATGFTHIYYDKEGKIIKAVRDVLPPAQYLSTKSTTFKLVPQPDGTLEAREFTTTRQKDVGEPVQIPTPPSQQSKPVPQKVGTASSPTAVSKSGQVVGGRIPNKVETASEAAMDADNRYYIMMRNIQQPSAQGDIALLFNHIGMTLGAQKGARITDAEIRKAMTARSLPQDLLGKLESWGVMGYLTGRKDLPPGGFLTPEQRTNMLQLAQEMREMIWWKAKNVRDFYQYQGKEASPNPALPPVKTMKEGLGSTSTKPSIVKMQMPDGRVWDVPSEKVEEAKSRGAKEVQ